MTFRRQVTTAFAASGGFAVLAVVLYVLGPILVGGESSELWLMLGLQTSVLSSIILLVFFGIFRLVGKNMYHLAYEDRLPANGFRFEYIPLFRFLFWIDENGKDLDARTR